MTSICKFCSYHPDQSNYINTHKSFAELVSESCTQVEKDNDNIVSVSDKPAIICWLLTHASNSTIDLLCIESIVNQYMTTSEENISDILKQHGVCLLIDENIVQCDSQWQTNAMYFAVTHGQTDIMLMLLGSNRTPSVLNKILHMSVKVNQIKIMNKIVDLGADIHSKDSTTNDCSILEYACTKGHLNIVQWLLEHKSPEFTPESLTSALVLCVQYEQYSIAEYLISRKVIVTYEVVCKAAVIGHIGVLIWLLENGGKLCLKRDPNHETLVHIAAYYGHLDLLKWLVTKGGDLHAFDHIGKTPLILAALAGHFECVEYLVHRDCDINKRPTINMYFMHSYDSNHYNFKISVCDEENLRISPIQAAVDSGNIHIVKFLAQHGADLSVKNKFDKNLLHLAANNFEMMKELVILGLDVHSTTYRYSTRSLLTYVAEYNNAEAAEWLLAQGLPVSDIIETVVRNWSYKQPSLVMLNVILKHITDINLDINGETLLHKAVWSIELVKILLEHNANINAVSKIDKNTPLLLSLKYYEENIKNNLRIPRFLLSKGADVKMENKSGVTALHHSVKYKNLAFIKQLISRGADVNAMNDDNKYVSALNEAASIGSLEIVKCLVQSGANVDIKGCFNQTALNFASSEKHWNIVKYLVEKGANITHTPNFGSPVILDAICAEELELTYWLADHGGLENISMSIHESMRFKKENERFDIIELFICDGFDINEKDCDNNSLLHLNYKHPKIVDLLINFDIDVNLQGRNGKTVLHLFLEDDSKNKNLNIVQRLIRLGANVNIEDKMGNTPLHIAVKDPIYSDLARILVMNGANINAKDNYGNSILHNVTQADLAIWLCERGADINAVNRKNESVLYHALRICPLYNSNVNIIHFLNARQSRILYSSPHHVTDQILYKRYLHYIEYLIDNVNNINQADSDGATVLYPAAQYGNIAIFDMLRAKVDTTKIKNNNSTIMHELCSDNNCDAYVIAGTYFDSNLANCDHLPMIKHLLEHMNQDGAQFKTNNKDGETAGETALHAAVRSERLDVVKLLVEHGIDIHQRNKNRETALHLAINFDAYDILTYLVGKGIDVNLKNNHGDTVFKYVVQADKIELAKLLLEHGADVHIKDASGETVLHNAVEYAGLEIVKLLIKHGVDVHHKNREEETALQVARKRFYYNEELCNIIVAFLVDHISNLSQ